MEVRIGIVLGRVMPTSNHLPVWRGSVALCLGLGLASVGATTGGTAGAAGATDRSTAERLPAQQFSADIVSRDAAGVAVGAPARLYAANRQVRIDMAGAASGYFLIDGDAGNVLFVRPAERVFMDAKQSTLLTQIFVPIDPTDPCRQWQAAAKNAGAPNGGVDWRCARVDAGTDSRAAVDSRGTVDGRDAVDPRGAVEYRVVSPDQKASQRWVDPRLEFPVKLQAADGTTIALEHIRFEAQPANLFAVPPSYRKFDPQALIERIKHSDVWADSPH